MRKVLLVFLSVLLLMSCKKEKLSSYVDVFIGTGGHGHTYPGAILPFGMVQLSPDTRLTGWDGCSGYHNTDSIIYGFSHTHLSGTGVPDYGDILLMPFSGKTQLKSGYVNENTKTDLGYGSVFRKETEFASPGFYKVSLDKNNIDVELTTTQRVGFHKYVFNNSTDQKIILDLQHRDKVIQSSLKIVSDTQVEGYRISEGWAVEQYIYFVIKFSKPFINRSLYINDSLQKTDYLTGKNLKSVFEFDKTNEPVLVKVAVSAVDIAGATKNLEVELPDWDFELVKKQAQEKWENSLHKIEVKGNSKSDKVKFYTALYHTMVVPNIFMDVDKRYRGTDLKIHKADNFTNYTVFSLWDTYRATHPLYTLIERKRTTDFIKTFLQQYKNGGRLPMWELASNYTGCMIGYHSVPVIADAYINGITNFNYNLALEAMLASANSNKLGLEPYRNFGYVPANIESESVSKTLEYSYDDWCIAQYAKAIGNDTVYKEFIKRAQYYKNMFDPQTGFMRAKYDGTFVSPFEPTEVNFNYTEANSWQYSFYVPQDIEGLIKLQGGAENLEVKLDSLFSVSSKTTGRHQVDITGLIGQYAHGNEPSHHMAYLYSYLGKPEKTQKYVNKIKETLYTTQPDGLSGNEDCGQMSAWYIMSAMGFYPVTPASGEYILGTPTFKEVKINLENGKSFIIKARKLNKNSFYVKKMYKNGNEYKKLYLKTTDILNGGEFEFVMTENPNKVSVKDFVRPIQEIEETPILISPFAKAESNIFTEEVEVTLNTVKNQSEIYFYTEGEKPKKYTEPLVFKNSTTLFFYTKSDKGKSKVIKSSYYKIPKNITISIKEPYASHYAANGDKTLVDGITGGTDFRLGAWQGYWGKNLEAVITFENVKKINGLVLSCLQSARSWIFLPEKVEFFTSLNGVNYKKVGEVYPKTKLDDYEPKIELFTTDLKNTKAKYIKVIAYNTKPIPDWHLGAGNPRWIFVDELFIK